MEVVTVMGFVLIFIFCFSLFVQLFFYWIFFARFAYHKPDSIAYPDEEGVSVILCVKNEAHCLKRHLRSFLEQNYSLTIDMGVIDGLEDDILVYIFEYYVDVSNVGTLQVLSSIINRRIDELASRNNF